jgi:hypothetical protein
MLQGFSLTHFSGRSISCYQDIPLMPIAGTVSDSPGNSWSSYVQSLKVNGVVYNSPWIAWDTLAGSAGLDFTRGESSLGQPGPGRPII